MDKPVEIDEENDSHLKYRNVMRDEKSKTAVTYVRNPEDETRPSTILADIAKCDERLNNRNPLRN